MLWHYLCGDEHKAHMEHGELTHSTRGCLAGGSLPSAAASTSPASGLPPAPKAAGALALAPPPALPLEPLPPLLLAAPGPAAAGGATTAAPGIGLDDEAAPDDGHSKMACSSRVADDGMADPPALNAGSTISSHCRL